MKNSSRFEHDDGEKLHALEQRMIVLDRLVEHALVELQPAQLAVDVEVGTAENDIFGRSGLFQSLSVAASMAVSGLRRASMPAPVTAL